MVEEPLFGDPRSIVGRPHQSVAKLKEQPLVKCPKCSGTLFVPVQQKRYISAIVSPNGSLGLLSEERFACVFCMFEALHRQEDVTLYSIGDLTREGEKQRLENLAPSTAPVSS